MHTKIYTYYKDLCKKFNKIVIVGDFNLESIKGWNQPTSSNFRENLYVQTFYDLGLE